MGILRFRRWLQDRFAGRPAEISLTPERRRDQEPEPEPPWDPDVPVELPIDGALDLHHFDPRDLRALVPDYLQACRERGILEVRVIHGKGKGQVRRSVHAILERLPIVERYRLAPPERGGWGATLVQLRPLED